MAGVKGRGTYQDDEQDAPPEGDEEHAGVGLLDVVGVLLAASLVGT